MVHVVAISHGLWGNPRHMKSVATALNKFYPELYVFLSSKNSGYFTYDGVDVCGYRFADEIEKYIAKLTAQGLVVDKFSIVGYSLGGLISRYAIGVLYSRGFFDKIQAINFTTFASPHIGVRGGKRGFYMSMRASVISTTGTHLFLRGSGTPLLEQMSLPTSKFYHGLACFKNRALFGNIVNDISVPFNNACLEMENPYLGLENLELEYTDKDRKVLVQYGRPPKSRSAPDISKTARLELARQSLLYMLMPVFLLMFLLNCIIQISRSKFRSRQHLRALEPSPSMEFDSTIVSAEVTQDVYEKYEESKYQGIEDQPETATHLEPTDSESIIIRNLQTLEFKRFPVHIENTKYSHAAIIVRMQNKQYLEEGWIVIDHWVKDVFQPA